MDFKARNTEESDYISMMEWWKWHRFPIITRDILPDDFTSGLMVSYKGVVLCSGFVYRTSSSSLFWVEWIVSNPEIKDNQVRQDGLRFLIRGLSFMAKQMGAKSLFTSLVNPKLIEAYKDCGFKQGSTNSTEMIKSF